MKNWASNFDSQILSRGLDYYSANRVKITGFSQSVIEAQVDGSRVYDVLITFKDSTITSMFCDCPYYQGHGLCKHLAAVLYYIEENPDLIKPDNYSDLLNSLSKEELVEFLDSELQSNPELIAKLKLFKNNEADEDFYITKLKHCLNNTKDILKFMDFEITDLITNNQFTLMFKLLTIIIDNVNEQLEYGYYPSYEDIIYKIDDIVSKVRNTASTDDITDFLMNALESSDDYYIDDILTDCMSRNGDMQRLIDSWEEK